MKKPSFGTIIMRLEPINFLHKYLTQHVTRSIILTFFLKIYSIAFFENLIRNLLLKLSHHDLWLWLSEMFFSELEVLISGLETNSQKISLQEMPSWRELKQRSQGIISSYNWIGSYQ